jgi:ABC-2 type transport system permease protein
VTAPTDDLTNFGLPGHSTPFAQIKAIATRDFWVEISYQFALLARAFSIAASVATYYFISKIVDPAQLHSYGGRYFEFVLIGLLLGAISSVGLGAFTETIQAEQTSGTLEVLLATPTALPTLFVGSLIVPLGFAIVEIFLVFGVAIVAMGADFQAKGMLTAALAMPPTLALFAAVGALSASFIVLSKRGDPFTPVITQSTNFLAGALFPIAVLPGFLQGVAHLLPPFYALQVLREGLINGQSISDVTGDYALLVLFAIVLLPLSLIALKKALRVARVTGTLGSY